MFGIYDATNNSSEDWVLDHRKFVLNDNVYQEMSIKAHLNGRSFFIQIYILGKTCAQWDKRTLENNMAVVADQIYRLTIENQANSIVSIHFDGHHAKVLNYSLVNNQPSIISQNLPELKGKVSGFAVEIYLTTKVLFEMTFCFCSTLRNRGLRDDIHELTKLLRTNQIIEKRILTISMFKQFLDAFGKIEDPARRQWILKNLEIHLDKTIVWLPYLAMVLDANLLPINLDDWSSVVSWERILEMPIAPIQLLLEFNGRGIDINQPDLDNQQTLLMAALFQKKTDLVWAILQKAPLSNINQKNLNGDSVLSLTCKWGELDVFRKIVRIEGIEFDSQCFMQAIVNHHFLIIAEILISGLVSNINQKFYGSTYLTQACAEGYSDIVKLLLGHPNIDPNQHNQYDQTPLELAILHDFPRVVEALLQDSRVDPNVTKEKDEIYPPLVQAFDLNKPTIFSTLLSHPKIKLKPLFEFLEDEPELIYFNYECMKVFFDSKQNDCQIWLNEHPAIQIAHLVHSSKLSEAHSLLERCLQAEAPFDMTLLVKIGHSVFPLIKQHQQQVREWLLKNNTLQSIPSQNQYQILKLVHPVKKYLNSDMIMTARGMKIVIEYLRHKPMPSLPKTDCVTVCKDRLTFSKKLKGLADNSEIQDGYQHFFIVTKYKANPQGVSGHVTPVYFSRVKGAWEIIISDSTTNRTNISDTSGSCEPILALIGQLQKVIGDAFKVRHIHICTLARQRDPISCPVFALRDLVYFYRHGEQFLQQLNANVAVEDLSTTIHPFHDLPLEMMKITQMIEKITAFNFERVEKGLNVHITTRKGSGKETLMENLERHTKLDDYGVPFNALIKDRREKYQSEIINYLIGKMRADSGT